MWKTTISREIGADCSAQDWPGGTQRGYRPVLKTDFSVGCPALTNNVFFSAVNLATVRGPRDDKPITIPWTCGVLRLEHRGA